MAKKIAVCNQKGGVGKTSTSISLAAGLAIEGKKTLLIDLDPQANATSGLGINKKEVQTSVYDILLGDLNLKDVLLQSCIADLMIAPSNENLSGAEVELVSEIGREARLKKIISAAENEFDFIIVDCPPSLGLLTINALTAADSVLIPLQCEYYALEGLSQLVKTVSLVTNHLNDQLKIEGILMTMADFRTKLTEQVIDEVKKYFGNKVYKTIIPRNIRLSEAPGFGKPIYLYDKESEGAKKYREFVLEFLQRCTDAKSKDNFLGSNQSNETASAMREGD